MKLELKYLAPYLPYKLKFVMTSDYTEEFCYEDWDGSEEDYKEGAIWEYCGENAKDLFIPIGEGDLSRVFRKGNTWISIDSNGMKPLLRPLSDLTKEIEVNGERFVPLRKINNDVLFSAHYYVDNYYNDGILKYCIPNIKHSDNHHVGVDEVYRFMQKLFEWHFDVFGLIEKGLAIDINTINQ